MTEMFVNVTERQFQAIQGIYARDGFASIETLRGELLKLLRFAVLFNGGNWDEARSLNGENTEVRVVPDNGHFWL